VQVQHELNHGVAAQRLGATHFLGRREVEPVAEGRQAVEQHFSGSARRCRSPAISCARPTNSVISAGKLLAVMLGVRSGGKAQRMPGGQASYTRTEGANPSNLCGPSSAKLTSTGGRSLTLSNAASDTSV